MNLSVKQRSSTSKASDTNLKEVTSTETSATSSHSASQISEGTVATKKSNFPNTFTTPQNCFEILNSEKNSQPATCNPQNSTTSQLK